MDHMKIIHLPNSTTPYDSCGYERIPETADENQEIIIQCRIEDSKDNHSTPLLHFILNNGDEKVFTGNFKNMDGDGREYYGFPIGRYHFGDNIRYRISCSDSEGETVTRWYEFEIYEKQEFKLPYRILYRKDSILLLFLLDINIFFTVDFKLGENNIGINASVVSSISEQYKDLADKELIIKCNSYLIHINRKPFGLAIEDRSGAPLIQWREESEFLQIRKDRKNCVHSISFEAMLKGEAFYGFGEKYNRVNQKGLQHKNYVYEHFTHQEEKSYFPIPFFFTEAGYGCFYDTDYPANYLLKEKEDGILLTFDAVTDIDQASDSLYLFFGQPIEILKQYYSLEKACSLPPKWSFGPWMSSNGWNTQKETLEQLDEMKRYKIPATVLVLEAWSDEATFYIFNDAGYEPKQGDDKFKYNEFSFERSGKWPDPKKMTEILHDNNVKLILWQIPVIKHFDKECCEQHRNDEMTVIEKGYCVRYEDGTPYRITDNWFKDSLVLDFTNPEAKEWWFSKRSYLVDELEADGFKTDGGEFIYDNDVVFSNGERGLQMRNRYPVIYEEGYHEFLEKHKDKGNGILFSRAGYTGAQAFPLHWAGDQMSEYSEFRAQIKAGLSAGLSGILFWGFDIAGFAGDLPTTDLYLRSVEMAAFSPIMQFHSEPRSGQFFLDSRRSLNNDRSPWNMAQVNHDPGILTVFQKYANIRMNLIPYLYNEAIYCCREGRPMLGHLILDYPGDGRILNIEDEYMLGRSLLVAPVIYEGAAARSIYLPEGTWYDFWNGKEYSGGREFDSDCPMENIPVFVKEGSAIPFNLPKTLRLGEFTGSNRMDYTCFTVKTFGKQGVLNFEDDIGNRFTIQWEDENRTISGECLISSISFL